MTKKKIKTILSIFLILINSTFALADNDTAPKIFRVDDSVRSGCLFNIYGEFIFIEEIKAVLAESDGKAFSEEFFLNVEFVDEKGQFATLIFPENLPGGVYKLSIKNRSGWSDPILINRIRPLYISDEKISVENEVIICGRNMDGREFGAELKTQVTLVKNNERYSAVITETNPFAVRFKLNAELPIGIYDVEITNDSYTWVKAAHQLEVVTKSDISLELGVAWENEFKWSNVRNLNSGGTDLIDDTENIQTEINELSKSGGGILSISSGNFYFTKLNLPDNIVLFGNGKESTKLIYRPNVTETNMSELNKVVAINSTGNTGYQGLADLTLTMADEISNDYLPHGFFSLGNGNYLQNADSRTAQCIFLKNVSVNYKKDIPLLSKSLGRMTIQAGKNVLVENCDFTGYHANITSSFIGKYVKFTNNTFDTIIGCMYLYSQYSIIENNIIKRLQNNDLEETDYGTQGIYTRSDTYVANNTIINTGNKSGDGEIIAAEEFRGGTKMYGDIVNANDLTIQINPRTNSNGDVLGGDYGGGSSAWDFTKKPSGDWQIVIMDGKGVGQYRQITAINKDTKILTIDKKWDILPDHTSKFSVVMLLSNMTFYKNRAENCSWALLFYGPTIDSVCADNTLIDTGGIQMHVIQKEAYENDSLNNMDCRANMGYFNRFERNNLSGASWVGLTSEISIIAKIETGQPFGKAVFGTTIRDNQITGTNKSVSDILNEQRQGLNLGNYHRNGIAIAAKFNKEKPLTAPIHAVIVEDNKVSNSSDGITVSGFSYKYDMDNKYMLNLNGSAGYGITIKKNIFKNVERGITDYSHNKRFTQIGSSDFPDNDSFAVAKYQDYCYLSCKDNGLKIFNIKKPESPFLIESTNTDYNGTAVADGSSNICVSNDMLYVAFSNGIREYSLENPQAPSLVNTYTAAINAKSICFVDGAMIAACQGSGIIVYDLTKKISKKYTLSSELGKVNALYNEQNNLIVVYEKGIANYDLTDLSNLENTYYGLVSEVGTLNNILANQNQIFLFDVGGKSIFRASKPKDLQDLRAVSFNKIDFGFEIIDPRSGFLVGDTLYIGTANSTVTGSAKPGIYTFDIRENPKLTGNYLNSTSFVGMKAENGLIYGACRTKGLVIVKEERTECLAEPDTGVYLNGFIAIDKRSGNTELNMEVVNKDETSKKCVLIAGIYNGNKLETVRLDDSVLNFGKNSRTIKLGDVNLTNKKIKIFIWRDMENIIPVFFENFNNIER